MTPHETAKRRVLAEWLVKAGSDLDLAEHLFRESLPYRSAIAFHCQQSAEKHLKALLVWREIPFPKTHDIKVLLNLVGGPDPELACVLQGAVALTPYGVDIRYPGDSQDVTSEDACRAVEMAQRVREAVLGVLPPA